MTYYDAEGVYNPPIEPARNGDPDCYADCLPEGWGGLVEDAHAAIRVTLEELAMLASIVTAETVTHTLAHSPASSDRSAYSLLLEPAFFRLPS